MHDTRELRGHVTCRTRMNSVDEIVLARYTALRIGGRGFQTKMCDWRSPRGKRHDASDRHAAWHSGNRSFVAGSRTPRRNLVAEALVVNLLQAVKSTLGANRRFDLMGLALWLVTEADRRMQCRALVPGVSAPNLLS